VNGDMYDRPLVHELCEEAGAIVDFLRQYPRYAEAALYVLDNLPAERNIAALEELISSVQDGAWESGDFRPSPDRFYSDHGVDDSDYAAEDIEDDLEELQSCSSEEFTEDYDSAGRPPNRAFQEGSMDDLIVDDDRREYESDLDE